LTAVELMSTPTSGGLFGVNRPTDFSPSDEPLRAIRVLLH
jgi:hypothetical protein